MLLSEEMRVREVMRMGLHVMGMAMMGLRVMVGVCCRPSMHGGQRGSSGQM